MKIFHFSLFYRKILKYLFLSNNVHLNVNIESMDMFNFLYIVDYICYSRSNTILYSILVLSTVVESELLTQVGLEKAQRGSTTIVQNKVCFEIL